jgi:flagellar basal-body rod modification protein FlgD
MIDQDNPQEDFIKLLVAQISNQDPDNPLDATQMITQYAQINAALGLNRLAKASEVFQKVQTAGTLMNQQVVVIDPITKGSLSGKVAGIDFSGVMPRINVGGQMFNLDDVTSVGSV